MCVYGPIVYECLDSVLRSQVHLLRQRRPDRRGAILSPLVGRARSPAARVACESESGAADLCVREWECARLGENACRDGKRSKPIRRDTIEKNATISLAKDSGKKFCLCVRLILKSLKGRTLDMENTKKSSSKGFFFFFVVNSLS
ncbi:hypothetical protein FQA47_017836 [Oryzias melastigma]|uniref:Uncharacterized protein n=1 Tax=Oryzias melastigma TaxID=30732 RepID=A0A834C9Y8_ORYME|nr:hypothetical protein FQA47_017836 [Oryzias melastigma]